PVRDGGASGHHPVRSRVAAARVRHRLPARPRHAGDAGSALRRTPGAPRSDRVPRQHGTRGADRRGRAVRDAAQRPPGGGGGPRAPAQEPRQPGNRFLALPNVIVTPPLGGATWDVTRHQSDIVVDAMERWLRGERPRWIADPAVLAKRAGWCEAAP